MDRYKETITTWDTLAARYQDNFMHLHIYNESYDLFCEKIENKIANIFEIACGPGNITQYLLQKNPQYNIDAIDTSPNMILLAKKNNSTANYRVMDCRQIDSITKKYDGIICGFCLPYLNQNDCQKLIKDSSELLTNNGVLYISTIEGKYEQSGYETGSTGDRMYVYYYEADFLIDCCKQNQFNAVETIRIPFTKRNGLIETHLILMARKK